MATASRPDTTIAASAVWSMVDDEEALGASEVRTQPRRSQAATDTAKVQSAPAAASFPSSASVCGRMRTTPSTTPHR